MDVTSIRSRFPALARTVSDSPAIYLDGPGGTQVPRSVIAAMAGFLERGGSNLHGPFAASRDSDRTVDAARRAVADLYGSSPDEIVFGQNMTSLTYQISRALARTWSPGDNIVLTRLDHDANVTPWAQAARDAGVEVRFVDFSPEQGCRLDMGSLDVVLDERTRLVAATYASNAVGTITPIAEIVERSHAVGALTYVDAVHYAPHGPIDVSALGTDFLVSSSYKWFGPHTGCLYGRLDVLDGVQPYKLRPSPDVAPDRWETGTQSFESLAGVAAAIDYLASLATGVGSGASRRERLLDAYREIGLHERNLAQRFLDGLAELPAVHLVGRPEAAGRTPTFAIHVDGISPLAVATELGRRGIFVWSGDYYAVEVMARLGRSEHGLVRIGFVHYTTTDEVDAVIGALGDIA
jgi:cysteine desulfurase family protein (TIGR01976 family)